MGMAALVRTACFRLAAAAGFGLLVALPAAALEIRDLTSPGGTPFWLVEEPSIPIVAVELSFAGGARLDPPGREGVANLMAGLLEEGSGALDAIAFATARDLQSARFGFSAGADSVDVSARMLVESLDESVALLAGALASPRFDPEPLERVRAQVLAAIAEDETDPESVAAKAWFAAAFPGHSYGRPADGTPESVRAIAREDLLSARSRLLVRSAARIGIVGAIGSEAAGEMVDRLLAGLDAGTAPEPGRTDLAPPPGIRVIALDVPQSAAVFGHLGLPRDDPDYIAAYVMNYVLGGGGFASRLMDEVREKRGLAYGVYSYLADMDETALYLGGVQTANERMAESLEVIRAEWSRMAAEGVTAEELDNAKKYLTGAFPLSFDSNARIANYLVFMQEEKLGKDYIDRRNALVEAVTLDDVRRVAARLLKPEALSVVVVGKPVGLE